MNGLVGRFAQFKYINNEVSVAYLKFNDDSAGLVVMQLDVMAPQQHWVPIRKQEAFFGPIKNQQTIH